MMRHGETPPDFVLPYLPSNILEHILSYLFIFNFSLTAARFSSSRLRSRAAAQHHRLRLTPSTEQAPGGWSSRGLKVEQCAQR